MREFPLERFRTRGARINMVTGSCAPRSRSGGRALAGLLLLAAAMAALPAAFGQPSPAMPAPAPTPVFAIKGFKVLGENPLGDGETSRVLAPFLRADATMETLQKATASLEAA